jgi:endonuclease/exonuclease/phosphatase family metal-dependent hydrolase
VTHVGRRSLQAEVAGVVAFLDPDVRRMPVVLAGDLNTAPFAQVLDPLHTGTKTARIGHPRADARSASASTWLPQTSWRATTSGRRPTTRSTSASTGAPVLPSTPHSGLRALPQTFSWSTR